MYLDFQKISKEIQFQTLLDNLNITYSKKGNYLKGKYKDIMFVIDIVKNIFVNPNDKKQTGSVINFLALITNSNLRIAAEELQKQYFTPVKEPKREIPELTLTYHQYLETYGISKETAKKYEVGLVKNKSIFSGKIAFRCYENNQPTGYFAYDPKEKRWIFPKNFKRTLYNDKERSYPQVIVVCNPFDCLWLVDKGIDNVVCLVGKSMTETQEGALNKYKQIVLLHNEPDNILNRLAHKCYVKAPPLIKSIKEYNAEEIMSF